MTYTSMQLTRCQSNDAKSQRELYDLFKARVMGLCRRYTSCKEEAEDVFQETFIRVFQNIRQVQDVGHLEQWIIKIGVNAAINYYHKNKRHLHVHELNGFHHENGDYELILSSISDSQLIELINHLPENFRQIFNLFVVEGYSHVEIAKLLEIPESTSRSHLHRAKNLLKCKLKSIGILKYEAYV